MNAALSLQYINRLAVTDESRPKHIAQAFSVKAMPTDGLVVGVCHTGGSSRIPDDDHASLIHIVRMWLQREGCLAEIAGDENRRGRIRLPGDTEIEGDDVLSHGSTVRQERPLLPR